MSAGQYVRMKNRAMMSPAETKQYVLARYRAGFQPYDIANRLGILVGDVRLLLSLEGIETPPPVSLGTSHPMWDFDDDRRREAIAKRAAAGAKRTREELEQGCQ